MEFFSMRLSKFTSFSIIVTTLSACGGNEVVYTFTPPITAYLQKSPNSSEQLDPIQIMSRVTFPENSATKPYYELENGDHLPIENSQIWLDKEKNYSLQPHYQTEGHLLHSVASYDYSEGEFNDYMMVSKLALNKLLKPERKSVYKKEFETENEFNERKIQTIKTYEHNLEQWQKDKDNKYVVLELTYSNKKYRRPQYDADKKAWVFNVQTLWGGEKSDFDPLYINTYLYRGNSLSLNCNGNCPDILFPQERSEAEKQGWNRRNTVIVILSSIQKHDRKEPYKEGEYSYIDMTNKWSGEVMLMSGIQSTTTGEEKVFISYQSNKFTEKKFDIFAKDYAYYQNGTLEIRDYHEPLAKVIQYKNTHLQKGS